MQCAATVVVRVVCNHHPSLERDRITNDIPLVFLLMSFFTWKIAVLQKPIWQIHDSKWQKMHEDTLFFSNIECHIVIGLYVKYHKEIFILKIQIRQKNILTVSSATAKNTFNLQKRTYRISANSFFPWIVSPLSIVSVATIQFMKNCHNAETILFFNWHVYTVPNFNWKDHYSSFQFL